MFGWHLKYKIWHIFKWSKQQGLYLFIAYLFFPRTMGTYYFYPVYHLWLPWVSFLFLCCHIVQEVNTLWKLNAWYIDLVALGTLVLLIADNIGTILSVPNEVKPFSVSYNREAGILFKKILTRVVISLLSIECLIGLLSSKCLLCTCYNKVIKQIIENN